MDQPSAWLEFPSGERIYVRGICTLGRGPENRVVIASERISRRHAVIRENDDASFTLMDLGSSNGTYLNGQRLTQSTVLRDHSVIEIGSQKMTFRSVAAATAGAAETEVRESDCWLLVVAAAERGCRTPSQDLIDKTYESWTARCQKVIAQNRGCTMRGLDDSVLAFWPSDGREADTASVVAALRSLRALQKHLEEFRFALHFGAARLKRAATGVESPVGPDVILTMQLDRVASIVNCPVLITESANQKLGDALPTRRLTAEESREYRGIMRFFAPVSL